MFCPKCGKELRDGAIFCNGCGASLQEEVQIDNQPLDEKIQWKPFVVSALIGLAGYLVLSIILSVFTNSTFGYYGGNAINAVAMFIGVSTVIILIVRAIVNKKAKKATTSLVVGLIMEIVFLLVSIILPGLIAGIISGGYDDVAYVLYSMLRCFGTIAILSFIIALLLGFLIRSKPILLEIITIAISLLASILSLILIYHLIYQGRLALGSLAIVFGIIQPFVVMIPNIVKGSTSTAKVKVQESKSVSYSTMFCPNCGMRFPTGKKFCDQCGTELKETVTTENIAYNTVNPQDAPSTGFGVLGFFFPVVGLILYLAWKDQTPLKAKSTGKGALIGVITQVSLTILYYIVYFVLLSSLFTSLF